jgi:1-acyl-sn-glycerol-3-phosphate acyltransferase
MISANHSSFIDPFAILATFWHRRVFSLATKDLYDTPKKRFIFESMRCIKVDKENFSLDSFHEVTRRLKSGKVICIFPEGQINFESNDILAFKTGVILMAHTAGVPIVPIYLAPVGKWYERRVTVVGQPINIREICGFMPTIDDLNRAGDIVRAKEQELKEFYYSKYNICDSESVGSEKKEEVILK